MKSLRKGTDRTYAPQAGLGGSLVDPAACRGTWRMKAYSAGHCSQQGRDWKRRWEVVVGWGVGGSTHQPLPRRAEGKQIFPAASAR